MLDEEMGSLLLSLFSKDNHVVQQCIKSSGSSPSHKFCHYGDYDRPGNERGHRDQNYFAGWLTLDYGEQNAKRYQKEHSQAKNQENDKLDRFSDSTEFRVD